MIPPSLSKQVEERSFRAQNGGLEGEDTAAFLDACANDQVAVLGWEAWLVNHRDSFAGDLVVAPGERCGMIPVLWSSVPAVIGGTTSERASQVSWLVFVEHSIAEIRSQLTKFSPEVETTALWLPHLRVNFTIVEEHS